VILLERRPRLPRPIYLAGYPRRVRRLFIWYDGLSDLQRVQYVLLVLAFLLACAGYLLGLGSTILLRHVEAEEATLAAQRLLTPEPTQEVIFVPAPQDMPTTVATATISSATATPRPAAPTPTPFSAPVIAEKPAAPRVVPANPPPNPPPRVPAAAPPTATPKPRNVENATSALPTANVRTPPPATARPATAGPTLAATPLPTIRIPATPATQATATPTPKGKPAPTAVLPTPGKTSTPGR
jgi:hypothetical protein